MYLIISFLIYLCDFPKMNCRTVDKTRVGKGLCVGIAQFMLLIGPRGTRACNLFIRLANQLIDKGRLNNIFSINSQCKVIKLVAQTQPDLKTR